MLFKRLVEDLEKHGDDWRIIFERIGYDGEGGYPMDVEVFVRGELLGILKDVDYYENEIEIPIYEEKVFIDCDLGDTNKQRMVWSKGTEITPGHYEYREIVFREVYES